MEFRRVLFRSLVEISSPIVIFVEEIDRLRSLRFAADDFFHLIRSLHEQAAHDPVVRRLCFCLVGVTTPGDLIRDPQSSPFNFGKAIDLSGFTLAEAQPLELGLQGRVADPHAVLERVLHWSGGQPFLTQKLLDLVVQEASAQGRASDSGLSAATSGQSLLEELDALVRRRVIDNWEAQDQPPHLKTLQDRLLQSPERIRGKLLDLYAQILEQGSIPADDHSYEQIHLRLTGLVVRRPGGLAIYNPIYQEVFGPDWTRRAIDHMRPPIYAEAIGAWQTARPEERSSLLISGALLTKALEWAEDKQLGEDDQKFLRASSAAAQAARLAEEQARLAEERARVAELETTRALEQAKQAEKDRQLAELLANNRKKQATRLGIAFVTMAGLAGLAGWQWQAAQQSKQEAWASERRARASEESAVKSKDLADAQQRKAQLERDKAVKAENKASDQRTIADQKAQEAIRARNVADAATKAEAVQRGKAEQQTRIATQQTRTAQKQTQIARLREQAARVLNLLPTSEAVYGMVLAIDTWEIGRAHV